jgi:scyllo-inositol 2-dehydrogenase (NADP+)
MRFMSDSIRTGVIGFGLAGRIFHTAVIAATPGLELACIVQRTGDDAAQAYPGVKIARSIDELLGDDSIGLVVVATPSADHYEHAAQCLKAGRNVLIDKPFTLTSEEAHKLIQLARERNLLLTAYQSRRWDGDFVTLKQVIASGELGRIVTFESHMDRYRAAPRKHAWRESGGPGGGILFDLGAHLIDQATVLFGDPASVWADVRVERDSAKADDAFDVQMKFAGVTALLRSTLTAATPGPRFQVHGTRGSFTKFGIDPQEDQLKAGMKFTDPGFGKDPENLWGVLQIAGEPPRKIETAAGDYRDLYANVRDALLGKGKLEVAAEQALRTTRLIELCRESALSGCTVRYSG